MFRQDTVERVALIYERGGAIPMIEMILSPSGTGRIGLSPLAWVVAQDLLAGQGRSLTDQNIVRVLNEELTTASKARLDLPQDAAGRFIKITRRRVEQISTQLARRLSYGEDSAPGLEAGERQVRQARLELILDAVIDGSKPLDLAPTGHYATDGSGIHAWSRRPGYVDKLPAKKSRDSAGEALQAGDLPVADDTLAADQSAEPSPDKEAERRKSKDSDAHHGYKTAKAGEKEIFFGYDLYPWIRVRREGDQTDYPHLVERFRLYPAGSDEPDSTLPTIEQMHVAPIDPANPLPLSERIGKGPYPIAQLLTDRAWSYKLPERWANPLRTLAIAQVVDLHENDHGVRDYEGMRIIAGSAHCPAMPDEHIDIRRPARLALTPETTIGDSTVPMTDEEMTQAQRDTKDFVTRVEDRRRWAMVRTANKKTGERLTCPARELKVSCPLIALSDTQAVRDSGVPRVENPPAADGRPQCCKQATVELPWTVTPKVRQTHYWGSVKWIKSFARRTHVEGFFGNVKNRNCENLARGWVQKAGLVKTSLGMAFVLAAYNRRIAQSWNDRTGASTDPAFGPVPPFLGYREVTEDDADYGQEAA